jgi:hypothetical protein
MMDTQELVHDARRAGPSSAEVAREEEQVGFGAGVGPGPRDRRLSPTALPLPHAPCQPRRSSSSRDTDSLDNERYGLNLAGAAAREHASAGDPSGRIAPVPKHEAQVRRFRT